MFNGRCQYIELIGSDDLPLLCSRPTAGEYCAEHQKAIAEIEKLDKEVQKLCSGRRMPD
jgi:hypothetical protein